MALTFRPCLSTQYDKNVSMSSWDWKINKKSSFASGNSLPRAFLSAFCWSSLFICRKAGSVTSPQNKSLWFCTQYQAVWSSLTMVGCCTWIYKYIMAQKNETIYPTCMQLRDIWPLKSFTLSVSSSTTTLLLGDCLVVVHFDTLKTGSRVPWRSWDASSVQCANLCPCLCKICKCICTLFLLTPF